MKVVNEGRMIFNRLARPFDAMRSLRGLTTTDTLKILLALLMGYFSISVSKVLKPARASIEKRFGAYRIDFIKKLTNIKYILHMMSDGYYIVMRLQWVDYNITSSSFEREVKQIFKPKRGEVVVDLGAHIGLYTIRAARTVGKDGLVIALEPDPENFTLLNVNVKFNTLSNVVALRMAAYESDGFSIMHKCAGSSGHSLVRVPHKFIGEIKVPTITLDSLVRKYNLDRVDWLKIDVEGAELYVLKGADKALDRGIIKNLIVEVWYENANEVFSILKRRGYEITILVKYVYGMYILAKRRHRLEYNRVLNVLNKRLILNALEDVKS